MEETLGPSPPTSPDPLVGPEIPEQSVEGEVVLMVGSPAEMREATSFSGDRIGGMGGMTLAELRKLAKGREMTFETPREHKTVPNRLPGTRCLASSGDQ